MSELEKIQAYIRNTAMRKAFKGYSMRYSEMLALFGSCNESTIDGIILAFEYGQAKGYRAGKKAAKA